MEKKKRASSLSFLIGGSLVRHNLDLMHIKKNISDNIVRTLLDVHGKNKDSLNARLDLVDMKMHDKLRAKLVGDKYELPKTPFNLTLSERRQVDAFLLNLSTPDGYSSNILRCVILEDGRILGMKNYNCHVFMQDLLLLTFRGIMDDKVLELLVELSRHFKQLCSKNLTIDVLDQWRKA